MTILGCNKWIITGNVKNYKACSFYYRLFLLHVNVCQNVLKVVVQRNRSSMVLMK